jgi:transposase
LTRDLASLEDEIQRAKKRFDLPESSRVVNCYEAGRDGFWLHRYLVEHGIENLVVDNSSIQVNRRTRQAKTDRLDVEKLLSQLIRYRSGEGDVWSVVRVLSVKAEDKCHLHRELKPLKKDRTRHINRIKSFLVGQGIQMKVKKSFLEEIERVRKWDGSALPERLKPGWSENTNDCSWYRNISRSLSGSVWRQSVIRKKKVWRRCEHFCG